MKSLDSKSGILNREAGLDYEDWPVTLSSNTTKEGDMKEQSIQGKIS